MSFVWKCDNDVWKNIVGWVLGCGQIFVTICVGLKSNFRRFCHVKRLEMILLLSIRAFAGHFSLEFTLAPIWLPHWPTWICTISLIFTELSTFKLFTKFLNLRWLRDLKSFKSNWNLIRLSSDLYSCRARNEPESKRQFMTRDNRIIIWKHYCRKSIWSIHN